MNKWWVSLLLAMAIPRWGVAGQKISPFAKTGVKATLVRVAKIAFSDGKSEASVQVVTRSDLKVLVFDHASKKRRIIPFAEIKEFQVIMVEEGMEKEWRWREGGSDEKVYTGQAYPWRTISIKVTRKDGTVLAGDLTQGFPLTLQKKTKRTKVIVRPKMKGKNGQTLKDLVYLCRIQFPAAEEPNAPSKTD